MEISYQLIQVFAWTALTFVFAMLLTPVYEKMAKKFKLGKQIRTEALSGEKATVFQELHAKKTGTPTMAGIIMWGSVLLVVALSRLLSFIGVLDQSILQRGTVYLPLFTLLTMGLLGAVDDYLNVKEVNGKQGMKALPKIVFLILFAILGAWWFYFKLEYNFIHIPGLGDIEIGIWYIPLFILVIISSASAVNITDGLDGLAGGLLGLAYAAFGVIAFVNGQLPLAIFCGVMIGSLMAFLWFNIPPAKFYMGDTGSLAYGATLGVIAMMTNALAVLVIVGGLFIIETLSVLIQLFSKKFFKKKVFLIAPLHHHLEKKGWTESQITMRFWLMGSTFAVAGLIIGLFGMDIPSV